MPDGRKHDPLPGLRTVAQRVTLKQLRAFVATARQSSFTRAGETLGLSQPALTSAIRQLEEAVGVQLLERTRRRVSLTADGEEFLPTAERIISDFAFAIEDLRASGKKRRERVGISTVFSIAISILPHIVPKFARDFPRVRIDLRDDHSAGVCRQVRRNEVDFGFASRDANEPELEFQLILRDRMGIVASRRHPLMQNDRPVGWNELEAYDFLGWGAATGTWLALRSADGIPSSVRSPRIELNNIPTLEALLESGLGVTAMPALAFPREGARGHRRPQPMPSLRHARSCRSA